MTKRDKQQLVAEFGKCTEKWSRTKFVAEHHEEIAAALTEWAQLSQFRPPAEIRRRAIEEAEREIRVRGIGYSPPDDVDADSVVESQIRAGEARACANAVARLKEPHD